MPRRRPRNPLSQSDDPAYPPPASDLEREIDQFLNRWQWRCPTSVARRELLALIAWARTRMGEVGGDRGEPSGAAQEGPYLEALEEPPLPLEEPPLP